MASLSRFIQNQARLLLQNKVYAWFLTAATAIFPYSGWMSLAIMSLVTLRQGSAAGFKCMLIGVTSTLCFIQLLGVTPDLLFNVLGTYVVCFASASLLKAYGSWQLIGGFVVSLAVISLIIIQLVTPEYIDQQYQALQAIIATAAPGSDVTTFFGSQSADSQARLANYLMGVKVVSLVVSALFSLMLARSIQATLFNPGGFKKEILQFRANRMAVLLLTVCMLGVYKHYPLLLSYLPVFFVYLLAVGISLSLNLLATKKSMAIMAILLVPIMVMPYIMLKAYVLFGSIDSLFNLRRYLPSRVGDCPNKG